MNTRLASRTLAIGLLCSPIAIQDCYAARIYNNLDYAIKVDGMFGSADNGTSIQIGPKQVSGSLQWTGSNGVNVSRTPGSQPVCAVGFGQHAQIQGGNYMVVSEQPGLGLSCVVYDSNHHPIAGR